MTTTDYHALAWRESDVSPGHLWMVGLPVRIMAWDPATAKDRYLLRLRVLLR